MHATLERKFNTTPLYMQVRDAIMGRIQAGEWRGGQMIPNEGDLAREFGVSQGTTRKALDLMEFQRVVVRRQGRGTSIREQLDWDTLPDNAKALLDALGGATVHSARIKDGSGHTYDAAALRELADGALEVAAWLERRATKKNGA